MSPRLSPAVQACLAAAGIPILISLGWLGYYRQPVPQTVGEPAGRGTEIELRAGQELLQPVEGVDLAHDQLQIAFLEQPARPPRLELRSERDHSSGTLELQSIEYTGTDVVGSYTLPGDLGSKLRYLALGSAHLSEGETIRLVADERSADHPQAALLREGKTFRRLPAALSLTIQDRVLRWQLVSATEKADVLRQVGWGGISAIVICGLALFGRWLSNRARRAQRLILLVLVLCLVLLGITGRVFLAGKLPLVNDEQSYVYDALLYQPLSPYFWKSPVLISAQAVWLTFVPLTSILWPRLLVIVAVVAAFGLLAWCAYRLAGRAAALGTLVVGLLLPPVMAHSSLVLQEHFMLLPVAGVAALSFQIRRRLRPAWWYVVILAVLVGVATLVRHSAVFWLLAVVVWLRTGRRREWGRRIAWLSVPYVMATVSFFLLFPGVVREYRFLGEFVRFFENSARQGWLAKIRRWREPFSQFMPLILLTLVAIGRKRWWQGVVTVGLFMIGALTVFAPVVMGTGPDYPGPRTLVLIGAAVLVAASWLIPGGYRREQWVDVLAFFLPPLLAYAIFDKVNAKYLAEFLPGLTLLAGMGFGRLLSALVRGSHRPTAAVALTILLTWLVPWWSYTWRKPYAGTLSLPAAQATVTYLRQTTRQDARIATGSNLLPIMAGRQPMFIIPHPAWYTPTFRGEVDPHFEQLFGPVADALERRQVDVFINEKLTTDTYLRHPRLQDALEQNYQVVAEFPNDNSAPIEILRPK